jgi:hypothetical protein
LQTYVKKTLSYAPEKVLFSTARTILIDGNSKVSEGTLIGTFTAVDVDSKVEDLEFVNLQASSDSESSKATIDKLEISNGNQLRVKNKQSVSEEELNNLFFSDIPKCAK